MPGGRAVAGRAAIRHPQRDQVLALDWDARPRCFCLRVWEFSGLCTGLYVCCGKRPPGYPQRRACACRRKRAWSPTSMRVPAFSDAASSGTAAWQPDGGPQQLTATCGVPELCHADESDPRVRFRDVGAPAASSGSFPDSIVDCPSTAPRSAGGRQPLRAHPQGHRAPGRPVDRTADPQPCTGSG